MKIASFIVTLVIATLFVLWWAFVRAPGPVEVCDHIMEVTLREAADQSLAAETQRRLIESTHAQCIEHKQDKLLLRGRIKYASYAKCVMRAQTLLEIGRC